LSGMRWRDPVDGGRHFGSGTLRRPGISDSRSRPRQTAAAARWQTSSKFGILGIAGLPAERNLLGSSAIKRNTSTSTRVFARKSPMSCQPSPSDIQPATIILIKRSTRDKPMVLSIERARRLMGRCSQRPKTFLAPGHSTTRAPRRRVPPGLAGERALIRMGHSTASSRPFP